MYILLYTIKNYAYLVSLYAGEPHRNVHMLISFDWQLAQHNQHWAAPSLNWQTFGILCNCAMKSLRSDTHMTCNYVYTYLFNFHGLQKNKSTCLTFFQQTDLDFGHVCNKYDYTLVLFHLEVCECVQLCSTKMSFEGMSANIVPRVCEDTGLGKKSYKYCP